MKQKILTIIMMFVFMMVFASLGTKTVCGAEYETETTKMVFEKVENKEQVKVSMNIKQNEGVSSFQTSIKLSAMGGEIKNVTMAWSQAIVTNAILKTANYNSTTGILSIYVVSKTELTELTDKGGIVLNIGTMGIEVENTFQMKIQMASGKTIFGDIAHNSTEVATDVNSDKLEIEVAAKENPDKPIDPDEPTDPDKPTDPDGPIDPDKPTDPDGPTNPEKPTDPDGSTDTEKPEDPKEPTNPDKPIDTNKPSSNDKNKDDGRAEGILPKTGAGEDYFIIAIIVVAVIAATTSMVIIKKRRNKMK